MSSPLSSDSAAAGSAPGAFPACADCGGFDAHDFGHVRLCVSCYAARGACCGGEQSDAACAVQPIVRAG